MSDTYAYFKDDEENDFGSGGPLPVNEEEEDRLNEFMTARSSGPRDVNVNWEKVKAQGQPKGGDDVAKLKGMSDYQEEQIRADLRLQEGAPSKRQNWYDWFMGNPDRFELDVQKVKAKRDKEGRNLSPERLKGKLSTFHQRGRIRDPTYDPKRNQAAQRKIRFASREQEHQIPKLLNLKNVGPNQAVVGKDKLGDGSPEEVYNAVYNEVVKQDKERNTGWINKIRYDLHDDDEAPGYTAPRDPTLETLDEYANRVATEYMNNYADEPGRIIELGEGMTKRDEKTLQKLWLERRRWLHRRSKQKEYDYAAQGVAEMATDKQEKFNKAGIGMFNVFGNTPSYGNTEDDAGSSRYYDDDDGQDPDFGGGRKTKRRRKMRKKRKTRKRKRIGKNKKELKRLQTQYRRFRIAKGDKRFKGTKGLVKWSRPSKAKRKGKKRSRRIYHRKRK